MDPAAILRRQGWAGEGRSLHPSGRGMSRPLLVSQRQDSLGLGAVTATTQWDQWWSKAFDKSLENMQLANSSKPESNLSATDSPHRKPASSLKTPPRDAGKQKLYAGFVKGSDLEGTNLEGSNPGGSNPGTVPAVAHAEADAICGSKSGIQTKAQQSDPSNDVERAARHGKTKRRRCLSMGESSDSRVRRAKSSGDKPSSQTYDGGESTRKKKRKTVKTRRRRDAPRCEVVKVAKQIE